MAPATNPPKQQRSRDSLERLLTAGLEVLENDGIEGFTIAAVAKRAGVGSTLVYRRFTDKNDLLGAIFNRFTEQRFNERLPAIEVLGRTGIGLDRLVFEYTDLLAASFRDHEHVMRAFITQNRRDPELAQLVEEGLRPMTAEFERALLSHRDEFRCADPELAVAFCFQSMLNTFAAVVTGTSRVHPEFGWDTVVRQLSLMTLGYLRSEPPAQHVYSGVD
jgi:AcrR family transcriptional regulator